MPQLEPPPLAASAAATKRPLAEVELLSARLERAIRRATGDRVRGLTVEIQDHAITVLGRCGTYYCKQQVQQAALTLMRDEPALRSDCLNNQIEVR